MRYQVIPVDDSISGDPIRWRLKGLMLGALSFIAGLALFAEKRNIVETMSAKHDLQTAAMTHAVVQDSSGEWIVVRSKL